jgi:hypothetical protein
MPLTECTCGSREFPEPVYDARGIFCCYVCDKCRAEKMSHLRPEIFTDPDDLADEPIDPGD